MNLSQIVYYVKKSGVKWSVDFGSIEDIYPSVVVIHRCELRDTRLVNGIPINKFETPTRWMKLPNGWSYKTLLFELSNEKLQLSENYDIRNPEDIRKAINDGVFVMANDNDHSVIEAEIDSKLGFRLVRKYPKYHPPYITVCRHEAFETYAEAQEVVDKHEAELERLANLTDEEWSISAGRSRLTLGALCSKPK